MIFFATSSITLTGIQTVFDRLDPPNEAKLNLEDLPAAWQINRDMGCSKARARRRLSEAEVLC